jgi:CRP/FNR family transcriptional regulator
MPGLEPVVQFDLRCTQCPVRHHAVCSALDGSHLHELSDIMAHRHFSAGDEILNQEETSQLFAVIVSGVVKLTRMLPDGREQIVGLLTATETLGEVNASVSHNSAECVTDVELCCFKRTQFEAVLREHSELGQYLLLKSRQDLEKAQQLMTLLGRMGAIEKVASFLLWLWREEQSHCLHKAESDGNPTINLLLKREEIATFLGATIETISRNISKLRTMGMIKLIDTKVIEITDIQGLRRIAQSDD